MCDKKHSWYECNECALLWLEKFPEDTDLYIKYLQDEIKRLVETILQLRDMDHV